MFSEHQEISSFNKTPYFYQKEQEHLKQTLQLSKRQELDHAIVQGLLVLGCMFLARRSLHNNHPFMFLVCLASAKASLTQHTKALSQYFQAQKKLKELNQNCG